MGLNPVSPVSAGIELRGVRKSFGKTAVLKGIDLTVPPSQKLLLLGPNGAGKSTLLRILAGLTPPDEGGMSGIPGGEPCGYVGHQLMLYRYLTVEENLDFATRLVGRGTADVAHSLERWGLGEVRKKMLPELSRGQQFRLSVCRALVTRPRYLFLDEPTASFDDRSVDILFNEIAACLAGERGGGVVIASHDIARVRGKVDRVIVLKGGTIAADSATSSGDDVIAFYREVNR